jgi:hypothetical protein
MTLLIDERKTINDSLIVENFVELLAPIKKYKKKWIAFDNIDSDDNVNVKNYGGNCWVWNNGLGRLMSDTVVSLISESIADQQCANFTEKTAFAIIACTFPIWIGGYNMASCWQDIGFDIFDDIIDHSYQNKHTLLERCFYAFELNKKILVDLDLARKIRNDNMHRLEKNRQLFFDGAVGRHNKLIVDSWPKEIKNAASYSIQKLMCPLECFR